MIEIVMMLEWVELDQLHSGIASAINTGPITVGDELSIAANDIVNERRLAKGYYRTLETGLLISFKREGGCTMNTFAFRPTKGRG